VADLRLDHASMQALQRDLSDIVGTLNAVRDAMQRVHAGPMGVAEFAHAAEGFGHGWKHGVSQLEDHAREAASMLTEVFDAFSRADQQLREQVRGFAS
jgi:phosphate uptake regulator